MQASFVRFAPLAAAALLLQAACAAPPRSPSTADGPSPERVLEVVGNEYAFSVADTVDAGRTVIRFRNDGKVLHELIVMKLRPGASLREMLRDPAPFGGFRADVDGGNAVLFAEAGTLGDGQLAVDLEPGARYALWCNFSDQEAAPAHSTLGMVKEIHVRTAPASPAPDSVRTLVVTVGDYAFALPDTLAPGPIDFRIRNQGLQRHELALSLLKPGVKPAFFFAEFRAGADVDSLYDDDGSILTAYPRDDNRTALRVDLLPDRVYVFICEFRDTEDAPTHIKLGMFKAIVVSSVP